MITTNKEIQILDFGLAKHKYQGDSALTSLNKAMGTPQYMAPEQCIDVANVDKRADLYSAGIILYELLTGKVPFQFESQSKIINAHLNIKPEPPSSINKALTKEIDVLVLKSIHKKKSERFQNANEFRKALSKAFSLQGNEMEISHMVVTNVSHFTPIPGLDTLTKGLYTENQKTTLPSIPEFTGSSSEISFDFSDMQSGEIVTDSYEQITSPDLSTITKRRYVYLSIFFTVVIFALILFYLKPSYLNYLGFNSLFNNIDNNKSELEIESTIEEDFIEYTDHLGKKKIRPIRKRKKSYRKHFKKKNTKDKPIKNEAVIIEPSKRLFETGPQEPKKEKRIRASEDLFE